MVPGALGAAATGGGAERPGTADLVAALGGAALALAFGSLPASHTINPHIPSPTPTPAAHPPASSPALLERIASSSAGQRLARVAPASSPEVDSEVAAVAAFWFGGGSALSSSAGAVAGRVGIGGGPVRGAATGAALTSAGPDCQPCGGTTCTMLPHLGQARIRPTACSLRTFSRALQVVQVIENNSTDIAR